MVIGVVKLSKFRMCCQKCKLFKVLCKVSTSFHSTSNHYWVASLVPDNKSWSVWFFRWKICFKRYIWGT